MSWFRKRGEKKQSKDNVFVVVDLETTGLSAKKDAIIEIGAIKVFLGQTNHLTFQAFVNPNRPIPTRITEITGITDEMVAGEETIDAVMPQFLDFIEDFPLAAYNAPFDMSFLQTSTANLSLSLNNPSIDVLTTARETLPDLQNHKLTTLAKHFNIDTPRSHRALDDCLTTLHVYDRLLVMNQ